MNCFRLVLTGLAVTLNCAIAVVADAQVREWSKVASLPTHGITDVFFDSDGVMFAHTDASEHGYRSLDAGYTWERLARRGTTCLLPSGELAAATRSTLFLSPDGGETWGTGIAFDTAGGDGASVVIGLDDDVILIGTYGGGIRRSTDAGVSWASSFGSVDNVASFIQLPDSRVLAGTTNGVFVSDDAGESFAHLTATTEFNVRTFSSDGSNIYAGTNNAFVIRSVDGGNTWSALSMPSENPNATCYALLALADGQLIAADPASGLYGTVDDGVSWRPCGEGITDPTSIYSISRRNDGVIFVAAGRAAPSLYTSDFIGAVRTPRLVAAEDRIRAHWLNGSELLICGRTDVLGVEIVDVLGRLAFSSRDVIAVGTDDACIVKVPRLPAGTYIVRLRTTSGIVSARVGQ